MVQGCTGRLTLGGDRVPRRRSRTKKHLSARPVHRRVRPQRLPHAGLRRVGVECVVGRVMAPQLRLVAPLPEK